MPFYTVLCPLRTVDLYYYWLFDVNIVLSLYIEFARYPSDPNRRLAQCVAAVSRALEAQKESEAHHQEAQQWKTKCTEVSRQLDVANRALSAVPHPQGYLINKNRELEDMISKQQQSLTEQETTLTDLTTQLSESVEAKAHLSHRLEQLLRQRAEVEGLRVLLERMQQYEEEEVNASSSEEDEESDDLEEPAPVCVKQSGSARRKSRCVMIFLGLYGALLY